MSQKVTMPFTFYTVQLAPQSPNIHRSCRSVTILFLHTIAIAVHYIYATFGQGSGPVLLSYVRCTGNESSLLSCSRSGTPSCSGYSHAGVVCHSCKFCIRYTSELLLWGGRC